MSRADRLAAASHIIRNYEPVAPGLLAVSCWCEREVVAVPQDDLRRGVTGSCGRRGCVPPRRLASRPDLAR